MTLSKTLSLRELAAVAEAKQEYDTATHFTLYKQDGQIKAIDSGVYSVFTETDALPNATFLRHFSIKLSKQSEDSYKCLKFIQKQFEEEFNRNFYIYNKEVNKVEGYAGHPF